MVIAEFQVICMWWTTTTTTIFTNIQHRHCCCCCCCRANWAFRVLLSLFCYSLKRMNGNSIHHQKTDGATVEAAVQVSTHTHSHTATECDLRKMNTVIHWPYARTKKTEKNECVFHSKGLKLYRAAKIWNIQRCVYRLCCCRLLRRYRFVPFRFRSVLFDSKIVLVTVSLTLSLVYDVYCVSFYHLFCDLLVRAIQSESRLPFYQMTRNVLHHVYSLLIKKTNQNHGIAFDAHVSHLLRCAVPCWS